MNSKRWNQLIRAVNEGEGAESVNPPLTAKELEIYRNMEKELAEMRQAHGPKAAFGPVENEW